MSDGDALARALERLARAREIKHELSNAAMGVIGYAELIAHQAEAPPAVRERAHAILDQGQRVITLLDELARVTRGAGEDG